VPQPSETVIAAGNAAVDEFKAYFAALAERRRTEPQDDLMTLLVQDEGEGAPLDDLDLVHNAAFLLNAGHETTANLIGNAVDALFRFPDQLALLRSRPELSETAVEEFLRYDSPNQLGGRRATVELELRGVRVPAQTFIWISNGAANRDPAQFPEPDRLDIARHPNRHLAFGHGIHLCLGAALARTEAKIALQRLVCEHPALRANGAPLHRLHPRYRGFLSYPIAV
jgi:cytochrome P450